MNDSGLAPLPDLASISKEDLFRYIELDLWSRFQARMWGVLTVFLTLVAVAGYFGVPYYIRAELEHRIAEQEAAFNQRLAETVAYGELLSMMAVRYHEARFELQKDISFLISSLKNAGTSNSSGEADKRIAASVDPVVRALEQAKSLTDYQAAAASLAASIPAGLAGMPVIAPGSITQSARTVIGVSPVTVAHPVQNGTFLGAIRDIQFRLVELEAYRRALADIESNLTALGASSSSTRRQSRAELSTLHDEAFSSRYAFHRSDLSSQLLDDAGRQLWTNTSSLYLLDAPLNLQDPK